MTISVDVHGPLTAVQKHSGANNHWVSLSEVGGDSYGFMTIFCPSYIAAKNIADAINAAWAERNTSPEPERATL